MRKGFLAAAALAAALVSAPASARPSRADVAAASRAARDAKLHERKGEWTEARDLLKHAMELNDTPKLRLALARVTEKAGAPREAASLLESVIDDPRASAGEKRKAKSELERVSAAVPKLTIVLSGASDASLTLDDVTVEASSALALEPGEHRLHAEAPGMKPFDTTFTVAVSEARTIEVKLEPAEEARPAPVAATSLGRSSTARTAGYVSLAVGGVGLAVGAVFALKAHSTKADLDTNCPNHACASSERELYDTGKTQADIATAGTIVGIVGLGAGAVLLLTAPSASEEKVGRVVPLVGPGSVGLRGRF